jgi:uncharacterized membrane protein YtjA (UPF0391 family)
MSTLLVWGAIAFIIAIVAGAFGFRGVSETSASVGKGLFGLFLVVAIVLVLLAVLGFAAIF